LFAPCALPFLYEPTILPVLTSQRGFMSHPTTIRILETDNNRKGDLFGRLMADLFVALGYEQPRLNIHKAGRELDLSTNHRLENRRAIAECKATTEHIGGGDLNKFVGALDAEREDDRPLTGYFISLQGFKETAIVQESKRRTKIIMLDGQQVVNELVKGRIVIPWDKATELSGRYCGPRDELILDSTAELLAHERGWIWAVYYLHGTLRSHFALIHSDGTPLAKAIADEVVLAEKACGGQLHTLNCLNPSPVKGTDNDDAGALVAYRTYLTNECGFIQLDGLPADADVGSRRLRLENLFVPLHIDIATKVNGETKKLERQKIGEALTQYRRLALLAAPGGGKSTLVKRLAVAYVDSARRKEITDELPERDWLPLFFRCRELRDLARGSFNELIQSLAEREPIRQQARVFRALVDRALLAGRVLLLVDGLDEISDPGDRAAFVCTLRSAAQAYPDTALLVTSREAGFRHVAAHLAPLCTLCNLSPFDSDDIQRLSVAWHTEVVGDNEKVRSDAKSLAATVVKNDRIKRLAVNPLLLTTLLLVKRWVGSLPTRRAVLYGKAVEVLLMTWNTEGHEPIPDDQALPQLCFVASAMMLEGVQKISRRRLASLLQDSRTALPTELGYVKDTIDEFIHRIEDRSSLLMMSGLDVEAGQLVEFFEFRHLTFQEFLTARATVEGWHPGRTETDTLVDVLKSHFKDEQWREVIPLAAVLGGKATEPLISELTKRVGAIEDPGWLNHRENSLLHALGNCLADEAAARPATIQAAMQQLVRFGGELFHSWNFARELCRGRYSKDFRDVARRFYLESIDDFVNARYALLSAVWWQTVSNEETEPYAADLFCEWLKDSSSLARCEGALGFVGLIFQADTIGSFETATISSWSSKIRESLISMLFSNNLPEEHVAIWLFALFGRFGIDQGEIDQDLLGRLFVIWQSSNDQPTREIAAYAIAVQPLGYRGKCNHCISLQVEQVASIMDNYDDLAEHQEYPAKAAVLIIAWYVRAIPDERLAEMLKQLIGQERYDQPTLETLTKLRAFIP
jgi:hypothetical protein